MSNKHHTLKTRGVAVVLKYGSSELQTPTALTQVPIRKEGGWVPQPVSKMWKKGNLSL
jgi:hypothetical protein